MTAKIEKNILLYGQIRLKKKLWTIHCRMGVYK